MFSHFLCSVLKELSRFRSLIQAARSPIDFFLFPFVCLLRVSLDFLNSETMSTGFLQLFRRESTHANEGHDFDLKSRKIYEEGSSVYRLSFNFLQLLRFISN